MKKLIRKLDSKFIAAKLRLDELMSKEDGMETLETVIVVLIALVVAGLVVNFLSGKDGKGGLVDNLFKAIKKKIGEIFGVNFDES